MSLPPGLLRHGPDVPHADPSLRPPGALVWCHVPDPARLAVVARIARDLDNDGDQITILVSTGPDPGPPHDHIADQTAPLPPRCRLVPAPDDTARAMRAFLAHWRPDALVWFGGPLRERTVTEAAGAVPTLILADAGPDTLRSASALWRTRLPRAALARFRHILCVDAATEARLRKAGLGEAQIRSTGALDAGHPVLPCRERERADLAATLSTRPIWLAADPATVPTPGELAALTQAHRIASHRAHRLLLVVATEDCAATVAHFAEAGLAVADRTSGEEPKDATEVLVAETAELGLFYRLAPISFLGGSLATAARRDPFEAAALGSALLHGPVTAPHAAALARLDAAGAARVVRSGAELGATLERLLSPDRAAQLAHAAWDVASQGAMSANVLISLLRDATDGTAAAPRSRGH